MKYRFEDTGFARLYLWTAKAKYTMGILYLALTLVYLFFGFVTDAPVALDFFTAIQMMFACFLIGIAQQLIAPRHSLTKSRCILWLAAGTLVTLSSSLVFGWFSDFPLWCFILFLAVLILGMAALLLSHDIELRRETQALNRQLEKFQSQRMREE